MPATELATFLRARMEELVLSNSEVAKRANLSRQTWHKLLNEKIGEAKLSTLIRLAGALEIHPMTLLQTYFQFEENTMPNKCDGVVCSTSAT